jgi:hypothetical protein
MSTMRFNDIATRVARAALAIEEPPRAVDAFVENLLSCHRDGDRLACMRFMERLVYHIFPDPDAAEDFALLVQTKAGQRKRDAARRRPLRSLEELGAPE